MPYSGWRFLVCMKSICHTVGRHLDKSCSNTSTRDSVLTVCVQVYSKMDQGICIKVPWMDLNCTAWRAALNMPLVFKCRHHMEIWMGLCDVIIMCPTTRQNSLDTSGQLCCLLHSSKRTACRYYDWLRRCRNFKLPCWSIKCNIDIFFIYCKGWLVRN